MRPVADHYQAQGPRVRVKMGDTSDDGFLSKEVRSRLRSVCYSPSGGLPRARHSGLGRYPSFGFRAAAPMAPGAMRHAVAPPLAAGAEQPVVPGARGGACSTPRVASAVPRRRRQARGARREGIYRTHWQQHSVVLCSCPRWDGLTQAIGPPPLAVRTHAHARAPVGSIGSAAPHAVRLDAGQCPHR